MLYRATTGGRAVPRLRWAGILGMLTTGLLCVGPLPATAQVGLASTVGSVMLVAHADPQGSISSVTPPRLTSQTGLLMEAVTTVRLSSNAGYRLLVRALEGAPSPVWVRSATGEFVQLTAGSSVTVAGAPRGSKEMLQDVYFRFEAPDSGGTLPPLPVRYELAIDPAI
jgi:hypothetical protein